MRYLPRPTARSDVVISFLDCTGGAPTNVFANDMCSCQAHTPNQVQPHAMPWLHGCPPRPHARLRLVRRIPHHRAVSGAGSAAVYLGEPYLGATAGSHSENDVKSVRFRAFQSAGQQIMMLFG